MTIYRCPCGELFDAEPDWCFSCATAGEEMDECKVNHVEPEAAGGEREGR